MSKIVSKVFCGRRRNMIAHDQENLTVCGKLHFIEREQSSIFDPSVKDKVFSLETSQNH